MRAVSFGSKKNDVWREATRLLSSSIELYDEYCVDDWMTEMPIFEISYEGGIWSFFDDDRFALRNA